MIEVRHKGSLIGHFGSQTEADEYIRKRDLDGDRNGTRPGHETATTEAKRAVGLYCRGNLVETFHTEADAMSERDRRISNQRSAKNGVPVRMTLEHWTVEPLA